MPQSDAAQAPAARDFAHGSGRVEEGLAGSEGKFVNGVHDDVVPHIENAGTFIALETVDVFRTT